MNLASCQIIIPVKIVDWIIEFLGIKKTHTEKFLDILNPTTQKNSVFEIDKYSYQKSGRLALNAIKTFG